jgi:hypothetical protein
VYTSLDAIWFLKVQVGRSAAPVNRRGSCSRRREAQTGVPQDKTIISETKSEQFWQYFQQSLIDVVIKRKTAAVHAPPYVCFIVVFLLEFLGFLIIDSFKVSMTIVSCVARALCNYVVTDAEMSC